MVADVHAAVEASLPGREEAEPWLHVAPLDFFVCPAPEAYGCLFGGEPNEAGFDPVAEARGFPENASDELWKTYGACESPSDESHVTLAELREVDWSETAANPAYLSFGSADGAPNDADLGSGAGRYRRPSELGELSAERRDLLTAGERVTWTDDPLYPGENRELARTELTREAACRRAGWWWVVDELLERLAAERVFAPEGIRVVAWRG